MAKHETEAAISRADEAEAWDWLYTAGAETFERFSQHQDEGNRALTELLKFTRFDDKRILEIGCGSGKYTGTVARQAREYLALDLSGPLLTIAKRKWAEVPGIKFINANEASIPLPADRVDMIFSSWGFPAYGVADESYREAARVLKDGGEMWVITNLPKGEYMDMRGESELKLKTQKRDWYISNGFELVSTIESNFGFASLEEAKEVLGNVFGDKARRYLDQNPNPKLEQSIAIYRKVNNKRSQLPEETRQE